MNKLTLDISGCYYKDILVGDLLYVIGDDIIIHKYWLDIDIYHQYISSEIGYPTIISEFIREVIFILDK